MANRERGEVALKIGEQSYTLRFNSNALAELEEALNEPLTVLFKKWNEELAGVREIRALLWAGLRSRHPKITLNQAGDLLDEGGIASVSAKLTEAIGAAFPSVQEADRGNAPAAAGNGAGS